MKVLTFLIFLLKLGFAINKFEYTFIFNLKILLYFFGYLLNFFPQLKFSILSGIFSLKHLTDCSLTVLWRIFNLSATAGKKYPLTMAAVKHVYRHFTPLKQTILSCQFLPLLIRNTLPHLQNFFPNWHLFEGKHFWR